MTATRGVDKRGNKRWRKREGTRIKRGRREESREGVGKTSVGARKPRVGWRNRNYLAGLSEATEEKGLVARVSCGRRLKYRKFKHRSTPPPTPLFVPRHTTATGFTFRLPLLPPLLFFPSRSPFPSSSTPPEAARDPPRFSASGRLRASLLYTAPFLATVAPLRVCPLVDRSSNTEDFFSRIDKIGFPPPPRIDRDGSFFLSFIFSDHVESDTGEGGRDRYLERHSPIEVITSLNDNSIAVVGPWWRGTNEHTRGAINRDSLSRG